MEVSEIASMLNDRVGDLVHVLLPAGRRDGQEWVEASTKSGGIGDSLKVRIGGARQGVWSYFGGDIHGISGGDALDLVAALQCGGSKREAVAWAKAWLGLDGADTAALEGQRKAAKVRHKERQRAAEKEAWSRRQAALKIWNAAAPDLAGTPAAGYLAGRGLALDRLPRQPLALRYHPALTHRETDRAHPALVACISRPDGKIAAVHRTFLEVHPDHTVTKLTGVSDAKMTLGDYRGGWIRLWRGDGLRPLKEAAGGEGCVITEGIEDGLTVALATPERRIAVAVSLANMAALDLPPAIQLVSLCVDNDAPGSDAAKLLARAVERYRRQGRTVEIIRSPAGKDINDLLRGIA